MQRARIVTDAGERSARLRQSSPFLILLSPAERQLRLTYKEGEGENAAQGEQVITVPDFVEVVHLAKSEDLGLVAPDRRVFLLVQDREQGPPAAVAIAVGLEGAVPPM